MPYMLSSLSDSQMSSIGFSETDMILKCTFNQQDCTKYILYPFANTKHNYLLPIIFRWSVSTIRDSQNGMCYTFNHKNMSQLHSIDRPGEISGRIAL